MYYLFSRIVLLRNNVYRTSSHFKTAIIPFSTTVIETPSPPNPQLTDYLMNSFGLSRVQAIFASTHFPPKTTPDSLNSVPDLLKQSGFSDTHIKNLIIKRPDYLSYIDRRLKSKIRLLQDLNFSGSALASLIIHSPKILGRGVQCHLTSNIDFLRSYLHSDENVVKVLKRNNSILVFDLRKRILPNIETLQRYGATDDQIASLFLKQPRFFSIRSDQLEDKISFAEKMGISPESKLFIYAVFVLSTMRRATLESKFDLFKSFGWSESDITFTFKKMPMFLAYSEGKVRAMMDFFLEEFECGPKEIALKPYLLTYSLEKRLAPRNKVLNILISKGLIKTKPQVIGVAKSTEKRFLKTYILPYVETIPDLHEAYMASTMKGK